MKYVNFRKIVGINLILFTVDVLFKDIICAKDVHVLSKHGNARVFKKQSRL